MLAISLRVRKASCSIVHTLPSAELPRRNLSNCCLLALHIWWCYSSRTSRSWWITQSTQRHRRQQGQLRVSDKRKTSNQIFGTTNVTLSLANRNCPRFLACIVFLWCNACHAERQLMAKRIRWREVIGRHSMRFFISDSRQWVVMKDLPDSEKLSYSSVNTSFHVCCKLHKVSFYKDNE